MKTFEFTDEQRHELIEIFVHGTIQELLSRIEQIVSERITPEQDTIKPYHEHGNSVASDRTESGQSAEEKALSALSFVRTYQTNNQRDWLKIYEDVVAGIVLHYASQVCADRDARITEQAAELRFRHDRIGELNFEIDRLNESMTVMLRKNAELEKELEYAKIR